MPKGRLTITALRASGLKNSQTFGKQDPYLDVRVGRINYRGKTITDGGVNPVFNQKYEFAITDEDKAIIAVWNSNSINSDDHLGDVSFSLDPVFQAGHQDVTGQVVTQKGSNKGTLSFILHFEKAGGSSSGAQPAPVAQPAAAPPQMTPEQKKQMDGVMAAWKKHEVPGKGGIDKNALHVMLNELGFFQGLDVQKQQQVVHAQFEAADTSKDGWIDFNEFAVMYNRLLDSMRQHPKAQQYVPQGAVFISPAHMPGAPAPAAPAAPAAPPGYQAAPAAPAGYPTAPGGYPPQQPGYPPAPGGYPPQQPGYPPAPGGYHPAPGGYPPQQPAYPPQQPAYPPAPGGYPPHPGYPPAPGGYPSQQPAYPQQPGVQYNVPPAGGVPSAKPVQYMQPAAYPQPMYYGAPMHGGKHGKGGKHKHKKYKKYKKYKGRKGRKGGFGMGGMAMALGGGLLAGAMLDDIFD